MIKRLLALAALFAVCAFIFSPLVAFAQAVAQAPSSSAAFDIVVPWGAWLSSAITGAASLAITAVGYVIARWLPAWIKAFLSDQLVSSSVNYAFGAVAGAVQGQVLDVKSTNAILTAAVNYAIANEPAIAGWLGATLRPAILAKLSAQGVVPSDVSAANVFAAVPTALK